MAVGSLYRPEAGLHVPLEIPIVILRVHALHCHGIACLLNSFISRAVLLFIFAVSSNATLWNIWPSLMYSKRPVTCNDTNKIFPVGLYAVSVSESWTFIVPVIVFFRLKFRTLLNFHTFGKSYYVEYLAFWYMFQNDCDRQWYH